METKVHARTGWTCVMIAVFGATTTGCLEYEEAGDRWGLYGSPGDASTATVTLQNVTMEGELNGQTVSGLPTIVEASVAYDELSYELYAIRPEGTVMTRSSLNMLQLEEENEWDDSVLGCQGVQNGIWEYDDQVESQVEITEAEHGSKNVTVTSVFDDHTDGSTGGTLTVRFTLPESAL